jgi:hypothetical protein
MTVVLTKGGGVTGEWRKLHNEELHNLYSSPDMWHAWERRENCTRFWWESPKERDHLEDQGVGGKMGSEWILERLDWGGGVDWIRLAKDWDRWRAVVRAVMNLRVLAPRI